MQTAKSHKTSGKKCWLEQISQVNLVGQRWSEWETGTKREISAHAGWRGEPELSEQCTHLPQASCALHRGAPRTLSQEIVIRKEW
jgi:hypothetical protein